MPFRSENPIVRVEPAGMRSIDTSDVENLFGLWTVFSKCAGTMEDGKRLENMSWRLWNRQALCCAPARARRFSFTRQSTSDSLQMPELSSSVESDASIPQEHESTCTSRPDLRRLDSTESKAGRTQKHMTPIDLQKIVISIKEQQDLEPLAPLPLSLQPQPHDAEPLLEPRPQSHIEDTTPRPSSPPLQTIPESSTSTVATTFGGSEFSNMSPPVGSDVSTSTDLSSTSAVHGFSAGHAPSSFRSKTQLAPTHSILKNSPQKAELRRVDRIEPKKIEAQRKKGAMFQLGTSSDEDGTSSLETPYSAHNLPEALKKQPIARKRASFKIGAEMATAHESDDDAAYDSEAIDSEDEEDPSESAIDDDEDDEGDWSDEEDSVPSSVNGSDMFKRVPSQANLTSRRSLLTTQLHEQDRLQALQNEASRSSPAIRRSRTSSPNGPSLATSPKRETIRMEPQGMLIPTKSALGMTSNAQAMSPRTTRRNMLSTELTESLRKNLLWERQQKNATSNAALKRRHTSNDVKNLRQFPDPSHGLAPIREHAARDARYNNSWNAYFDQGLQEYHTHGW